MILPRVLIFGQPFNDRNGGGITLSNLFKEWDRDKLAVAATGHLMQHLTTDVCEKYYQLGYEEYRWRFPFNFLQKKFESGVLGVVQEQDVSATMKKKGVRYFIVNSFFYPLLEWLGLFHKAASLNLSPRFKFWLDEFRPQLLYLQVSSLDTIKFAGELKKYLGIPSVIHMMDDWPSTISKRGPFRKAWGKRIDNEFRALLKSTDLFLSISEAMSTEYKRRYDKAFIPFHNPIDIKVWGKERKTVYELRGSHVKVLYSGRIGPGIKKSLIEVATAIEELNMEGLSIRFHIQSPGSDPVVIRSLLGFKCVVMNSVAEYSSLPGIYSGADILVIANDFDYHGLSFLRYSMPTKASEYMISGTPVLVYSHSETAVSRFFGDNKCGCCVVEQNKEVLKQALKHLINNEDYRATLGGNAVKVASELFDGEKKRKEFRQLLIDTATVSDKV